MYVYICIKKSSKNNTLCLIKLWYKKEQLFIIICVILKNSNTYYTFVFTSCMIILHLSIQHKYIDLFVFILPNILTYLILTIDWIV